MTSDYFANANIPLILSLFIIFKIMAQLDLTKILATENRKINSNNNSKIAVCNYTIQQLVSAI